MDEKTKAKLATKLITRSKTKASKSQKKIVSMLNNLSKDKTGAPVKWKFNKSGVQLANKVGKKLATAQEKDLKDSSSQKVESKDSSNIGEVPAKKKPGRPKVTKPDKQSELVSDTSFVSIERLSGKKLDSKQSEENEKNVDQLILDEQSEEIDTKTDKPKKGRRKKVLSKDIRIKRLEILKRHIEKESNKGPSRVKGIRSFHRKSSSEINTASSSPEMNQQSTVSINQDKLKILKEQIDSERRRGRGRGNYRRGRGRWKGVQSDAHSSSVESSTTSSNQTKDLDINEGTNIYIENRQLEILKRQLGRGGASRGRRGRPKWKNTNVGNRPVGSEVEIESNPLLSVDQTQMRNPPGRPRGIRRRQGSWTSLNRHTLNKSLLNKHMTPDSSLERSSITHQLSDSVVDSENESIDSNISSASSSKIRKRKSFHHMGIKLGPAKLLRSQDSMKTRNFKDSSLNRLPMKRKRTLSGEFELLDEVSLRKQMRDKDDDDASTVKSFDDSWVDVPDSDLNQSRTDVTKSESNANKNTEEKSVNISNRETSERRKMILNKRMKSIENLSKKDTVLRKRGRPARTLSTKLEGVIKQEKQETVSNSRTFPFISNNKTGRLTIIGPGGKCYIKIPSKPLEKETVLENIGTCINEIFDFKSEIKQDNLKEKSQIFEENTKTIKSDEIKDVVKSASLKPEAQLKEPKIEVKILKDEIKTDTSEDNTKTKSLEASLKSDNKDILEETEISPETILLSVKQVKYEKENQSIKDTETKNENYTQNNLESQHSDLEVPSNQPKIEEENQNLSNVCQDNAEQDEEQVIERRDEHSLTDTNNKKQVETLHSENANEPEKIRDDINLSYNNVEKLEKCSSMHSATGVEDKTLENEVTSVSIHKNDTASEVSHVEIGVTNEDNNIDNSIEKDKIKTTSDEQISQHANITDEVHKKNDLQISSNICVESRMSKTVNEDFETSDIDAIVSEVLENVLEKVSNQLDRELINEETQLGKSSHDVQKIETSGCDNENDMDVETSLPKKQKSDNESSSTSEEKTELMENASAVEKIEEEILNHEGDKTENKHIENRNDMDEEKSVENTETRSEETNVTCMGKPEQFDLPHIATQETESEVDTIDNSMTLGEQPDVTLNENESLIKTSYNDNTTEVEMKKTSTEKKKSLENEIQIQENGLKTTTIESSGENSVLDEKTSQKTVVANTNLRNVDDSTSESKIELNSTIEHTNESVSVLDHTSDHEPIIPSVSTSIDTQKKKRKKDLDNDSKSDPLESEVSDANKLSPETSSKTETKRVFQLRKKASRSPLEIIAMKHSMEERQYMLEETQRALRREEKQKKMFQNKLLRQTVEQLSPPKQSYENSPPKIVQNHSLSPEKHDEKDGINHCRPCSVVLIDFVKYLKMNEQSEQTNTSQSIDDFSEMDDESSNETASLEKVNAEVESTTLSTNSNTVSDSVSKISTHQPINNITATATTIGETVPEKRPAKARKQAKSYSYSSKLTAEIVSSPEPIESSNQTFMVPPLRLKIKQKEKFKKRFKGHHWTVSRNKARKQMSPTKRLTPKQQFEFETLTSNLDDEPSEKLLKLDGMTDISFTSTSSDVSLTENTLTGKKSSNLPLQSKNTLQNNMYRFKCIKCDFKSQNRNIMESHVYIHIKETPFKCFHCDSIYSNRNTAFNHSKREHSEKEPKIMSVSNVDESEFYEEIDLPSGSDNSNVIQADIHGVEHSSESLIISVRLPRNINDSTTACYCCSYCDYSSSKIKDINSHIDDRHKELMQYICSVCNTTVYRHGEGIAKHFSIEHPDQPVAFKSLPDYYDARKTIEKSSSNGDKGNIFERMSDLFAEKKDQGKDGKTKKAPEKTSAEADSTTAEMDDDISDPSVRPSVQKEPAVSQAKSPVHREPDGIEQLAQMYGPHSSSEGDKTCTQNDRNSISEEKTLDDNNGNDMGLKIVDVVSLPAGSDFAKNVWGEPSPVSKPVISFANQIPIQSMNRPPVLVPTSSLKSALQSNRPILPMPHRMPFSQSVNIDEAKLRETTTTYKCEKCNVHAPVLSAMVEHLRTGHKDIPRLFLCPFCRQYEGATEPDIHKHIKQFHPSPDTRSPPVALSSDAKQHLRTIEVPVGDTQKVNGKYLIEKNIYKCLKCKRHMPSLDYIYEHLEKEHNEVFVYVCPDCKRFRAKEEEVVFNHIKTVHNKNTDDIILSLAIEENLFTKVQCLIKDKSSQNKGQLQKQPLPPLTSQAMQNRQMPDHMTGSIQSRPQQMPTYQKPVMQPVRHAVQPVFPGMIQTQPVRMPGPALVQMPVHSQPNIRPPAPSQPMNKSAMRKSRPVHIPQQQQSVDHIPTTHTVQHLPNERRQLSSPPPLMRGPPPLIRFQGNENVPHSQSHSGQSSSIRSTNFSMSDKVHRLHPNSQGHSMAMNASPPPQGRPVLKVPSVPMRRTSATSPTMGDGRTSREGTPLDLSRNSTPNSQPDTSEDMEDMSPDAFQIFNLQPRQQTPQMRPTPYQQMPHNMPQQRLQQINQYNSNMYNRSRLYNPMYGRPPPPYSQALTPGQRSQGPMNISSNAPVPQPALFKCPYCTSLVALTMGEVGPHIKKFHPGQTIQFVKRDN